MSLTRWTTTIADAMAVTVTVETANPGEGEPGRVLDIDVRVCRPPEWPADRVQESPWGPTEVLMFETLMRSWSLSIKRGAPLLEVLQPDQRFEPAGHTTDPLIPVCRSPVDYVSRAIIARFVLGKTSGRAEEFKGPLS